MPHYQSAHDAVLDAATLLLSHVAANRPVDFAGTGVVFYENLTSLPFLQLGGAGTGGPPVNPAEADLETTLRELARLSSPWHDGFHFVEASSFALTHVAQFVSPPIPANLVKVQGTGARFMTAQLSSLVPGIICVGLISHEGQASIFVNGGLIRVKGS